MQNFENLREKYTKSELIEENALANPIEMFQRWMVDAINDKVTEPNAMILSTVDADGMPCSRTVLLKEIYEEGFVFYTNFTSNKAQQIDNNPKVSLLFLWHESQRQVRIYGEAKKIPAEKSSEYFIKRPRGSQVGAWASPQSDVIPDRAFLEKRKKEIVNKFVGKEKLEKPPFWGGYKIIPSKIEFWQGRDNRLHDRLQYSLQDNGSNTWKIERLAP